MLLTQIIEKDILVKFLLETCNLTHIQVDTLLCDLEGRKNKFSIFDRSIMRDKGPVEPGAFLRTKSQAQKNIKCSFVTLILLVYLGILPISSILSLAKIVGLIDDLRSSASESKKTEVLDILKRIIDEVSKT